MIQMKRVPLPHAEGLGALYVHLEKAKKKHAFERKKVNIWKFFAWKPQLFSQEPRLFTRDPQFFTHDRPHFTHDILPTTFYPQHFAHDILPTTFYPRHFTHDC